ncbi:CpsD/CapB family tyrosine-protein kinase [Ruegeria arenilitoris]|uniref:CpsD/CapB family tyrosine-protein kinase n=1 Tax=Ruegeria arenilitoris TaxID=1173585 RepID=UPI00147E6AAB|nr:CpsD/CapB family tyrosine-protein kinase [Ruegeria arenilitoris]
MERIQSAIQKAREAREQNAPTGPIDPEMFVAPSPLQEDVPSRGEQAWADLPVQDFNRRLFKKARIVTHEPGEKSGAFDAMRTRILHELRKNKWRRVAITSPGSGCGKSTLTLNLAFGLARQRDIRTMLVDLDMRNPSIERMLGVKLKNDFASALAGESSPEDHMFCYQKKLAFATNYKPAHNTSELLQGKDAARVIDGLEARYEPDVMLFDTPPLLTCDDTTAFLDQIDCVLLVAAAEASTVDEMKICEHEILQKSNLLGVVLNKCQFLDRAYTYGY